jgi:glycosyltransferase involved in cell wall biosynthesis
MVKTERKLVYINEEIRYYRLDFIQELAHQTDCELTVFTTNKTNADIKEQIVKFARLIEFKTVDLRRNEGFQNISWNLQLGLISYFDLKRIRPSHILIEGLVNLTLYLYNIFIRAKLICSYERTPQTEYSNGPLRNLVQKILASQISFFIVNGTNSANVVRYKLKSNVPMSMPNVTPYPFQVNDINTTSFRKPTFIYIGQDNDRKNTKYLRRLIAETPDNNWIILGFNYDAANVLFSGKVHWSKVSSYFLQSDYLVLPTLEDNFSLVVLEALACGVEPITTVFNGVVGDALIGDIKILSLDLNLDVELLSELTVPTAEERRKRIKVVSKYNAQNSIHNLLSKLSD